MPQITSNIQIVPPKGGNKQLEKIARQSAKGPETSGSDEWFKVVRRDRETKARRPASKQINEPPGHADMSIAETSRRVERRRYPRERRPPRTAAVALKAVDESATYAQILKAARDKVSLKDLGITNPRIRKAINGGVIIEISGEDGPVKADNLAGKLREAVGGMTQVVRPVAKGELLLIGIDDSVEMEEIISEVAEQGDCRRGEVKTGPMRQTRNGLGIIWIQCPVAAVGKLAEKGRLRLGWSTVKVEALKAKPVQCFRCWRIGHVRGLCKSRIDRSGRCFRCGKEGHQSRDCTEPFSCAICAEDGKESTHRIGAPGCVNHIGQDRRIRGN